MDDRSSIPSRGRIFPLLHHIQVGSDAHPASYPMGTGGSYPGVKRLGCEADHSPPFSAKVKMRGAVSPLPLSLHGIMLS